jgi:hypothetical protein
MWYKVVELYCKMAIGYYPTCEPEESRALSMTHPRDACQRIVTPGFACAGRGVDATAARFQQKQRKR